MLPISEIKRTHSRTHSPQIDVNYVEITTIISQIVFALSWIVNNSALESIQFMVLSTFSKEMEICPMKLCHFDDS